MLTRTADRVPLNTAEHVNEEIRARAERRVTFYARHPELIEQRLSELDHEWDLERLIETEGPTVTAAGLALGTLGSRGWLLLSVFAQGMMLLHATQGWYPMLPLFRRMGFRTPREIDAERAALQALRGDFRTADDPDRAFEAAYAARS